MREIVIERLGRQGDGLAGDIRAPFTLPEERVRGEIVDGAMAAAEILTPSPERIPPVCPHFGICGGCALQHGSDAFLADWKAGTIARALAAHGLSAPMLPVATSPARSRRRAVFAGRRTRKTVTVGFHGRRSEEIIDVTECHLVRPEILAARPALVALAEAHAKAYLRKERFKMYFAGSVRGLSVGAPVELRGIKIGRKKRPGMISTQRRLMLQDQHIELRLQLFQSVRAQAAGKPAADEN